MVGNEGEEQEGGQDEEQQADKLVQAMISCRLEPFHDGAENDS